MRSAPLVLNMGRGVGVRAVVGGENEYRPWQTRTRAPVFGECVFEGRLGESSVWPLNGSVGVRSLIYRALGPTGPEYGPGCGGAGGGGWGE